jgi:YggT family protein
VTIVCDLLQAYTLVLVVRAVLSWFPIRPDSGLVPVIRALDTIINPVLQPLRRVIPPAGMFDLSYIALFIIILILEGILCSGRSLVF